MRRKIPLSARIPGAALDCPLVQIRVRSKYGQFAVVRFTIDTGADLCALPVALARREGIDFPEKDGASEVAGLVGRAKSFRGALHLRLFGENFSWPCKFIDAPAGASNYGVIGRAGFVDAFAFCLNHPFFTLRRKRSFWRRLLTSLFPPWIPQHPEDVPL